MTRHVKQVEYIEFDADGKIFRTEKVQIMFCVGEDKKSERVIQISLPNDGERPYYASININPDMIRKMINENWQDYQNGWVPK